MSSKIRIRLDNVEVEYEGEHAFLATELLPMVEKLLALSPRDTSTPPKGDGSHHRHARSGGAAHVGTLGTVAAKLKVASGPELIVAALYHIAKSDHQETATRKTILDRMKTATAYYKSTFNNNMTTYLNNLVKGDKIRETAKDTYSLASSTTEELEAKLAQS